MSKPEEEEGIRPERFNWEPGELVEVPEEAILEKRVIAFVNGVPIHEER